MKLPPADLVYLRDEFRDLADEAAEHWESANIDEPGVEPPAQLAEAMTQLVDMLTLVDQNPSNVTSLPAELTTLGAYGLHLIDELGDRVRRLRLDQLHAGTESLALAFGLWLARHNGEIRNLGAIVNAVSRLADQATQPRTMANLYACCSDLFEAASPDCEEMVLADGRQPWRVLLCHRAVVATRSLNTDFMTAAFDAIVEHMPDAAQAFFAESMEQLAIVDYPETVRETVKRYYLANATQNHLH